jgi:hypothetical protein
MASDERPEPTNLFCVYDKLMSVSMIFRLDFGTVLTVWYFVLLYYSLYQIYLVKPDVVKSFWLA